MTKHEELRRLATEAKGWNITAIKSATDEDPCRLGTLYEDTDDFCELITIDCENYYKSSLPLAAYIAAASPDVVLALLADLERKDALLRRAGEVLKAEYAAEYDEALELAVLADIEKELAP